MRMKRLSVIIVIIIGLMFSGSAIADEGDDDHMDDHDMMGSWGMTYSAFWMLVLVLAIAIISVFLVKVLVSEPERPTYRAPSNAETLLDERYARGEIDTEEYLRMRHMMGR